MGALLAACGESGGSPPGGAGPSQGAGGGSAAPSASPPKRPAKRPELPGGGRELFPRYQMTGYCGLPGAAALGRLGTGDLDERVKEVRKKAEEYARDREPMPVLELLATIANPVPGAEGKYRTRTSPDTIERHLDAARRHEALLLLNVQPGQADMLEEVKALEKWLVHPDVGVAVDPEWDMGPGEVPGKKYGRTTGRELTAIAGYLSGIVEKHGLPEKPMVFHQVGLSVVPERSALRTSPGVVPIMSADGIGAPELKRQTWNGLVKSLPAGLHTGFKLFYDEDAEAEGSRVMTPSEVLKLRPTPEYVMYE
nr:hypothetical protein [Streptomyces sp. HNM0574]